MTYLLLIMVSYLFLGTLVLHCLGCVKGVYPEKVIAIFRVKEGSWLRKLFTFKETENNPYLYLTVIPLLIALVVLIATLVLYTIYWINPNLLQEFLVSMVARIISIFIFVINVVYAIILTTFQHMGKV